MCEKLEWMAMIKRPDEFTFDVITTQSTESMQGGIKDVLEEYESPLLLYKACSFGP